MEKEIKIIECEIKKLDAIRLQLRSSVDRINLELKKDGLNPTHGERWRVNTRLSLRDKERKLKSTNIKQNQLRAQLKELNKSLRKEEQRRLDSTFERLFIMNSKIILDKETFEKILDMTQKDMKL